MDILPKIINQYPELLEITRPGLQNVIWSNEMKYSPHFVESLIQIYTFFFEITPVVFVPRHYDHYHKGSIIADLENLEQLNVKGVLIFAYADITINEISKTNRRRLNTLLKNYSKKSKVIILSILDLSKVLPILETFTVKKKTNTRLKEIVNYYDLQDSDPETYQSNLESFIDMFQEFRDKKVYVSLNLSTTRLLEIESLLKQENKVFRKEQENTEGSYIILNSCKTTRTNLLKNKYDVYIYSLPNDLEELDFIEYFKDTFHDNCEVFVDTVNEYIEQVIEKVYQQPETRVLIKDSREIFESVESMDLEEHIFASEEYYRFTAPESIQTMDLRNLSKKDYDTIRNFIKLRLLTKYNIEIKTCQLTTPCSPKDRSRKLNSLSNRISSVDYRCDVTCEIFRDYTIGVVVWNETFVNKKDINCLKNETYVYQTTHGKWKWTTIS